MNLSDITKNIVIDNTRHYLYFKQYKYKVRMFIDDKQYFKNMIDKSPNRIINSRLFDIFQKSIQNNVCNFSIIDWYEQIKNKSVRMSISRNFIDLYLNDLSIFCDLMKNDDIKNNYFYIKKPVQEMIQESDVIRLSNPKNISRIYFKTKRLTTEEKNKFIDFIEINKKFINPCPSLKKSIIRSMNPDNDPLVHYGFMPANTMLLYQSHFVDFSDQEYVTLMCLCFSKFIRKIYRIEKR